MNWGPFKHYINSLIPCHGNAEECSEWDLELNYKTSWVQEKFALSCPASLLCQGQVLNWRDVGHSDLDWTFGSDAKNTLNLQIPLKHPTEKK